VELQSTGASLLDTIADTPTTHRYQTLTLAADMLQCK